MKTASPDSLFIPTSPTAPDTAPPIQPTAPTTEATDLAVQELHAAQELCVKLVVLDSIRAKSWTRRVFALKQRIGALSA